MKKYYRIMLGRKSRFAQAGFNGNFIGADYGIEKDLSGDLPDDWRDFNKKFIPIFLEIHPEKSRVAAGLACGMLWTLARGIVIGDIVLCPDGQGIYHIGEIVGDYQYMPTLPLPHIRKVKWFEQTINRADMSDALRHAAGAIGMMSNITQYADEIQKLLGTAPLPVLQVSGEEVENPYSFAIEAHLEDFLVKNWEHTELGKEYEVYKDGPDLVGQQYQTDTGPIDILAISKNKKILLVIELKRGRASDVVVGQVLRYMGYVKDMLAETSQEVRGLIIALDNDQRLKRAISVVPNIDFKRYEVTFKLKKD